jgi:23S rRNA (uracil1939-C5)-methyltransferase
MERKKGKPSGGRKRFPGTAETAGRKPRSGKEKRREDSGSDGLGLVTVTIEDMGNDGEGIGKTDGFTLFVKDAVLGDTVQARILKEKKNYAYARLEKLIKPSVFRVEPKCPCHRRCGGCQIQALAYEKQLELKESKIRNDLARIGRLPGETVNACMEPILGMEEPFHYRNKALYPVGTDKDGNLVVGFYARHTHSIIANQGCAIGARSHAAALRAVVEYMEENHVAPYDEKTGKGLVRHILIRNGYRTGEIMVCVVLYAEAARARKRQASADGRDLPEKRERTQFLPRQDALLEKLGKIDAMTSVSVNINDRKDNVVMGTKIHTLWGSPAIQDAIHVKDMRFSFKIYPLSFYQVNPVQMEKLYGLVLEYAGLTGKETVWDLYCGMGTISLFLAARARQVYGVEAVPQTIQNARENAERNQIGNVEYFVGKAEEVLPEKCREEGIRADVVVADPPRKGCGEACLDAMIRLRPERIVYVSCNPATLARDLRVLCGGGYEVTRLRGVDLFAQTHHVECVILLTRKEG